jgi:hypothetical protein
MPENLRLTLSPTQLDFVRTDANIAHLVGPMGEGKTHAGVAALIYHAKRCNINLKAAIIRDTHENIKTSTAQSIMEVLGDWGHFKDNYKKLHIKTRPSVDVDLFGIDDAASISKLQGPQYGLIWLEEPAPIHEKANAGLPYEVFTMGLARCGRQTGSRPRLQITQNPGDEEHWSTQLMDDPEEMVFDLDDGITVVVTKKTFNIPRGENKYLTPKQRAMNMAAFKDDPGKWARYVEGVVASVQLGKPVTPGYAPHIHFSQRILPVYPNLLGFRGWDGYQHPCVGIAQYNPTGQFVIHDALYEAGMGVQELIEEHYMPLISTPKYKDKIKGWRDIGDPSMRAPDQTTRTKSAARHIEDKLKTHFESGPTRWNNRIEPVNYALKRLLSEGRPAIILSASAVALHRALKGGWRYKTDNNGNILGKIPVKNEHSHPGDMFAYLISVIMPHSVQQDLKKFDKEASMKRAMSYGSGAHQYDKQTVRQPGLGFPGVN